MLHLGVDEDVITDGMKKLQPIAMRLEMKAGINHCSVINDSYNSDINSLSIAIDFLNQQSSRKKRTVILSDILQSGKDAEELYADIASILKQKDISRVIGIGPAISRQAGAFEMEKDFYQSTEDFMRKFSFTAFSNETILLKGARVFEFEQISKALQQKSHETVLEINLNAMVNNLNYFRSKISPITKIMAMVKAFSYGSGSYEIANLLQFHRVDYLTVAYADEGVELRKAGIILPIMVMNPEEHAFDAMIQHNLEPEIYNLRILGVLEKAIRKNILPANKPVKIHIKLETGMHRLGFDEADLDELSERIRNNRRLYVQSVFSHLSDSDNPDSDEFTRSQVTRFTEMCDRLCAGVDHPVLRHMTNSAGITRFPEAHFDMVRLGIGLYGIPTNGDDNGRLENVSTLRSSISQIKHVKAGERVGYGPATLNKDTDIAIVPVGYADGLSRKLGNGNSYLVINGKQAPLVGNICMDMCMVDINGIEAKEGDPVIIFGQERSISQLSEDLDTIPYEVMTSISRRVKRVYFQE
jgi:alanine racemase